VLASQFVLQSVNLFCRVTLEIFCVRVVPKKLNCYQIINKLRESMPMRLDFFSLKLKFQRSTIIFLAGVEYSMHDLICDAIYFE